jgi:hypothetical protein
MINITQHFTEGYNFIHMKHKIEPPYPCLKGWFMIPTFLKWVWVTYELFKMVWDAGFLDICWYILCSSREFYKDTKYIIIALHPENILGYHYLFSPKGKR